MSLLYLDGFDCYTSLGQRWDRANVGPTIGSYGRNGSAGVVLSIGNDDLTKNIAVQATTVILGFAFKTSGLIFGGLFAFGDANNWQGTGVLNSDGTISVYRGDVNSGGTFLGRSPNCVPPNVYHFLEVKWVLGDGLTGSVEIKLNGQAFYTLSALDTKATSLAYISRVKVGHRAVTFSTGTFYVDDVYILDASSSGDFLGDVNVEALFPTGAGNYAQFSPGGTDPAPTNWQSVDEGAPNDGTDLVASGAADDIDSYAYSNLVVSAGTILGVQPVLRAKKTNAGVRQLAGFARLSGVDAAGTGADLSTDWVTQYEVMETKPGGGAWAIADVNAAEFGAKVAA